MASRSRGVMLILAGVLGWIGAERAFAQTVAPATLDTPEKVRFVTADGVTLHGTFYKGPKAAPAVVMLHNVGDPLSASNKTHWVGLAKTLQVNFSVLTFDFRGHGASIDIDPSLYFKYAANVKATRGAGPNKTRLDIKDIDKLSYPLLVNDIAAAKAYLERTKNDLGFCNTQNFIVIGAEQGATLGAIWANSEWYRYKLDMPPPFFQPRLENRPEGQYLTAILALSMSSKLGSRDIGVSRTLDYPCRQNAVPIVYAYSDEDTKGKADNKAFERALKFTGKKEDKRLEYTGTVEIKGGGKLVGGELLQKSLKTSEMIDGWLKNVVQNNSQEWTQREFVKSKFAWKMNNPVALIPAKVINFPNPVFPPNPLFPPNFPLPDAVEKNLSFDTYERFTLR